MRFKCLIGVGMKSKLNCIILSCIVFSLAVSDLYAKPIDDFYANEETRLTSTSQEGNKSQISIIHSKSAVRKLVVQEK